MVLAVGFLLTVAVVTYVGYPLFVREPAPAADVLELAIAQRRARPLASRSSGVVCGACQAANDPGDRFCARCGRPLLAQRCTACGEPYDEGDVFCAKCGGRLSGRAG